MYICIYVENNHNKTAPADLLHILQSFLWLFLAARQVVEIDSNAILYE